MAGERTRMADMQREKPEAIWKCKVIQVLQEDSERSEMAKAIKRRERGIPSEQNAGSLVTYVMLRTMYF